jgi:hypothetical protein
VSAPGHIAALSRISTWSFGTYVPVRLAAVTGQRKMEAECRARNASKKCWKLWLVGRLPDNVLDVAAERHRECWVKRPEIASKQHQLRVTT